MFKKLIKNKKDTHLSIETNFNQLFLEYFQLGHECLKKEDYERARYYLNLAYGLSLSLDDLEVDEKLVDECNDILLRLEDKNLMYDKLLYDIEEKADDMSYEQMTIWSLLTLCRLKNVFQLFENEDGCEIFKQMPQIIENILAILMEEATDKQLKECQDFLSRLYDFTDSKTYNDPKVIASSIQKPLQITDLSAADITTSLDIFLDHEVNNYQSVDSSDDFVTDFVGGAFGILHAYYLRTTEDSIENIPQLQNELERIWKDYDLLQSEPDGDDIIHQMNIYMQTDIFQ